MLNLLEETLEIIKENNKSELDILWCGTREIYFDWK